jgi:serine-type D-Ala-D-Ala endopeptidase (penicillin-binding protein 7)
VLHEKISTEMCAALWRSFALRPTIAAMHQRLLAAILVATSLIGFEQDAVAAAKPLSGPQVKSASALIVDGNNGEVIFEQKAGLVTPIASITKLMTALVVIDGQQPLDEVITITAADRWKGKGAFSHIPNGAKITRGDLLRLALMASENLAARTLARHYPGGIPAFVKTMNVKAKALGMSRSHFDDPSGLSSLNTSSAQDLVKLVNAVSRDSRIREFSTLRSHEVRLNKKMFRYGNTNLLVGRPDWEILVQKTGFTNDAGQCLVMETTIDDRPVIMVFLNSFGSLTRTADARRVRKWMEAQDTPSVASAGAAAKR